MSTETSATTSSMDQSTVHPNTTDFLAPCDVGLNSALQCQISTLYSNEQTTELVWTIRNFWKLRVKDPGDCITSDLFHSLSGCVWTMALYPIGNKNQNHHEIGETRKHISLYLRLHQSSLVPSASVTFKFYTRCKTNSSRNIDRLLTDSKNFHTFRKNGEENSWGFPKVLKRCELSSHLDVNDSLTIRCLIGFKNSIEVLGISLKRKSPETLAQQSLEIGGRKAPKLDPVQQEVLRVAFPKLCSYLEKGCSPKERVPNERAEKTVGAFGDTSEKRPSDDVIEAIVALIANNTISPGHSVVDYLEMAVWSSRLHIKSAENTFYWLIAKYLTFESALAVMQHEYFDSFEPHFAKVVMYYVIKNMDQKTSNNAAWSCFKTRFPALIARLYNELMEISMMKLVK